MWCVEDLLAFIMSLVSCFFYFTPLFQFPSFVFPTYLLLIAFSPDTCHLPSNIHFLG